MVADGDNVKESFAARAGVGVDERNWSYCSSYGEMPKLVTRGSADVCTCVTPTSSSMMEASAAPQGIKVMDFNPELYPDWCEAFQSKQPVYSFNEITFGNEAAVGKHGWGSDGGWVSSADADQDLIYNMVKFFSENQEEIQGAFGTYSYYWSLDHAR